MAKGKKNEKKRKRKTEVKKKKKEYLWYDEAIVCSLLLM